MSNDQPAFERAIRRVLPKNSQIVMAILGVYTGTYALFKLKNSLTHEPKLTTPEEKFKEALKVEVPSASSTAGSGSDSDRFISGKWEMNNENLTSFLNWLNKPENQTAWQAARAKPSSH